MITEFWDERENTKTLRENKKLKNKEEQIMFENDKDLFGDFGELDLGSDLEKDFADFTPVDDGADMSSIFGDEKKEAENPPEPIAEEVAPTVIENAEQEAEELSEPAKKEDALEVKENEGTNTKQPEAAEVKEEPEKASNADLDLFDQVVAQAEEKQAESVKSGLADKFPVFSYANAKEEIVDTSKTFDQLRNEKAEDFPELDEAASVSWKVVYGTVTKNVANPKKTTIASVKKDIENSKSFLDSLKKAKGEIECKVTPMVTAKKKGVATASYKGVFNSVEEAVASGKVISFVPSEDGKVFEVRSNRIGTFIAETNQVSMLNKVKSGFIPALPKIPYQILSQIIAFFKSYITLDGENEAMACIYWSVKNLEYHVYIPKQTVSKARIDTNIPDINEDEYVLVMEIHSHNTMPAVFSYTDNDDEKATRLYTVIGRLNRVFPDINTRISVGGKFVSVEPSDVFEGISDTFPVKWNDAVEIAKPLPKEVIK